MIGYTLYEDLCDKTWIRRWTSATCDSNDFTSSHGTLLLCGLRWIAFPAQRNRTCHRPPCLLGCQSRRCTQCTYESTGNYLYPLVDDSSRRKVAVASPFPLCEYRSSPTTLLSVAVVAAVDVLTLRIAGISSARKSSSLHAEAGLLFVCVVCQTISSPYRRPNRGDGAESISSWAGVWFSRRRYRLVMRGNIIRYHLFAEPGYSEF